MARHKITPTERAPELTDAMRRASNKLSPPTAEALFGDQTKSSKTGKPASKSTLPTPRGSQDRATSEPVNAKLKRAPVKKTSAGTTNGNTRDKAHTSTPPASLVDTVSDISGAVNTSTIRPAKRQKTAEPTPPSRRSTRVIKAVRDDTPTSTSSSRASGTKNSATEGSNKTDPTDEDLAAVSANHRVTKAAATATGSVTDAAGGNNSLPSPASVPSDPGITADTNLDENEASTPRPHVVSQIAAVVSPQYASQVEQIPQVEGPVYRNLRTGQHVFPTPSTNMFDPNPYFRLPTSRENGIVDPNGTVFIPVQSVAGPVMGQMMMLPTDYSYLPGPGGVNGGPLEITHSSTKGQKVKGRPKPKNPKVIAPHPNSDGQNGNKDASGAISRPVANTYPRKQPFKSQIDFPGYPPGNQTIPDEYTLWEICQRLPNSLREQNLKDFVQHDWSANELCACLQDEARQILNNRPGKDKTMVFQKRLERFKKDLMAKGEYEALMAAPKTRVDGRPAWVKRGNVRRK